MKPFVNSDFMDYFYGYFMKWIFTEYFIIYPPAVNLRKKKYI